MSLIQEAKLKTLRFGYFNVPMELADPRVMPERVGVLHGYNLNIRNVQSTCLKH